MIIIITIIHFTVSENETINHVLTTQYSFIYLISIYLYLVPIIICNAEC